MDRSIAPTEVQEAIGSLQSGKSPGPDGLAVEYYKSFSPLLALVLRDMYNEAPTGSPTGHPVGGHYLSSP